MRRGPSEVAFERETINVRDEGIHDLGAGGDNLQPAQPIAVQHPQTVGFHAQETPQQAQGLLPVRFRQLAETLLRAIQYLLRLRFHLCESAAPRTFLRSYYGTRRSLR